MTFGLLVLLALIQAATEFIPVSSSGHLLVLKEWFAVSDNIAIDVLLHFATLVSLVWVFRDKLISLLTKSREKYMITALVAASIPAATAGFFLSDFIETSLRHPMIVAIMLIVVGLVMVLEDRLFMKEENTDDEKSIIKYLESGKQSKQFNLIVRSFSVGLFQALALIPGTSRSGASIIGGRVVGLNKRQATEFAFLIGIPVIAGATAKILLIDNALSEIEDSIVALTIAGILAVIVGVAVLKFLIEYVATKGLKVFGWYRIALALIIIATL